jgi:DNA repair protein RadC
MEFFPTKLAMLDHLAKDCTYLQISKKGKMHFSKKNKSTSPDEIGDYILAKFADKTKEELDEINKYIKERHNILHPFTSIKNWEMSERPREIMREKGPSALTNAQLLTILISMGQPGISAQTMAQNLLKTYHTFRELSQISFSEICRIPGIGLAKAAQIKAGIEIGVRLGKERIEKESKLKQPEQVLSYIANLVGIELQDSKKEYLYVILLDNKMKPIRTIFSTFGSIDTNVVDIGDIIRRVAEFGASSLILVHNHPSGETQPSQEDEETTRRVSKACNLVGVKLVDHVIVGSNPETYFSFQKNGLL